jgi:hypothetical protein
MIPLSPFKGLLMTLPLELTFEDAEPISHARPGRTGAPNPFSEAMKAIAGKINPTTGKPLAKKVVIAVGDPSDKAYNKLGRLVSNAGAGLDVRVSKSITPVNEPNDGTYTIVFWTTPLKTSETTPATDVSTAPTV